MSGGGPRQRGEGIALIGFRACGKTTVGRMVAHKLGRPFLDSDAEVERRTDRPIAEHFATTGEAGFREVEARTIEDLCRESPSAVLATGGGSIVSGGNREALRRFGLVVWLAAPPWVLIDRLRIDPGGRPALTDLGLLDEVLQVLKGREPLYRECCDVVLDASIAPGALADEIVRLVGAGSGGDPP